MPQSLTQLPKNALFKIGTCSVIIREHAVRNSHGLFDIVDQIITDAESDRNTLYSFEENKISYEAAIEWCVNEIEENVSMLADVLCRRYDKNQNINPYDIRRHRFFVFSKSKAGKKIATQLMEKIRSCDNWGELYEEMQPTSQFQKDIGERITVEIERYCEETQTGVPSCSAQLPKTADFEIGRQRIIIQDHMIEGNLDIFNIIMDIVRNSSSDRHTLYQFEKQGISYEVATEICAYNLEHGILVLENHILNYHELELIIDKYRMMFNPAAAYNFSESVKGLKNAALLVEKIKSCNNWGEFYDEMHPKSKFSKYIKKKIVKEMKEQ